MTLIHDSLIYCKVLPIKLRKGALLWHLESMYSLAELICNPTAWLTFGGKNCMELMCSCTYFSDIFLSGSFCVFVILCIYSCACVSVVILSDR